VKKAKIKAETKALPQELKRRARRSFLVGVSAFLTGALGLKWIFSRRDDDGIAWPLRKILQINEGFSRDFFSLRRRVPEIPRVTGREPRVNGDEGLGEERDFSNWMLKVVMPREAASDRELEISLREIQALPKMEVSFGFKCIEGWTDDMSCKGVRFSDFLDHYRLGTKTAGEDHAGYFPYVGLETPDGKYYVSIDMESMMHPQTLLCYEMNGAPLSFDNGAPLRLIIPVKYGIKNLKQIGSIRFADSRPPDYWAERGYDWYAGL
jgi:hypothetical protein